jgi:purine-cytosine permease-like protein
MAGGFQIFFGDDWEDAVDSVKSAPGALGGLALTAMRQLRAVDIAAFGLVVAGWAWLAAGFPGVSEPGNLHLTLAVFPTVLWFGAGIVGGLIFEVSGLGYRVLAYWEAYVLILLFALFGVTSLRIALNPHGRRVYRGPPPSATGS